MPKAIVALLSLAALAACEPMTTTPAGTGPDVIDAEEAEPIAAIESAAPTVTP